MIGFSGALGIVSALSIPAQQSLIAALVDEADVPQAVALNSMTFNLARAIGPASAAGVIATLGIPWAFAINSVSYLLLFAGLLLVRPRAEERAAAKLAARQPPAPARTAGARPGAARGDGRRALAPTR